MNIKISILNVPKHCNKHDLIHFITGAGVGDPETVNLEHKKVVKYLPV